MTGAASRCDRCKPGWIDPPAGATAPGPRSSTLSPPKAGQPGARPALPLASPVGYRTGLSTSSQPDLGPSPTTGTTKRLRARVAATYTSRTASARSRRDSSSAASRSSLGAQPQSGSTHRRRAESMCRLGVSRAAGQVGSARMTTGNSSPFALWTVVTRTPSVPSSTIGASLASPLSASASICSTNARNDDAPCSKCLARSTSLKQLARACSPFGQSAIPA